MLIESHEMKVAQLRPDDAFLKMIIAVQLVHAKVGVVAGYSGEEMQSLLQVCGTITGLCLAHKDSGYWLVYQPAQDRFYYLGGTSATQLGAGVW